MTNKKQSGQAMLFAAVLSAVLGIFITMSTLHFSSSLQNAVSFSNQQQTFYANQGMMNIAVEELNQWLLNNPTSNNKAQMASLMTTYLNTQLNALMPGFPNFVLNTALVAVISTNPAAVIPSGPYAGLQGPSTTVKVTLKMSQTTSPSVSNLNELMVLGALFPFQFILFNDFLQRFDLAPGPALSLLGEINVNGDLCLAPGSDLKLGSVRAAGVIITGDDPRCGYGPYPGTAYISTNVTDTAFAVINGGNDNGCTNCGGTTQSWAGYAKSIWGNNALDSARGTQVLALDTGTTGTPTQFGSHLTGAAIPFYSNDNDMRFLVDPPQAGDISVVSQQKFSNNADIRIVDGVWYLNDPAGVAPWPGLPIWSDHPGSADDTFGNRVGQDDIKSYWAGRGKSWGLSVPHSYSYYQYDETNKKLIDLVGVTKPYGVISYGSLGVNPQSLPTTRLVPSGWIDASQTMSPLCFNNAISCSSAGSTNGLLAASPSATSCTGATVSCTGPDPNVGWSTLILNATRSGFLNAEIKRFASPAGPGEAPILPVNVDIGAFQLALANVGAGELGSYFAGGSTSFMGHAFNGILYVTSTWPGSTSGYDTLNASNIPPQAYYPPQGSNTDASQAQAFSISAQQALPYQLCSNPITGAHPGVAGKPYDSDGLMNRFSVPDCSQYGTAINAYPNAIRIFNGANLSPALLPNGLSIVTPIPLYSAGDFNSSSVPSSTDPTQWVSALIAGDVWTVLSNNWTDAVADWQSTATSSNVRPATSTTINSAVMWGNNLNYSAGLPALYLEDWQGFNINFNGSVILAFYPTVQMSANDISGFTYIAPNRNIQFDPHFSAAANQPPGTPVIPITTVSKFTN